jgi:hypothetical protein
LRCNTLRTLWPLTVQRRIHLLAVSIFGAESVLRSDCGSDDKKI